MEVIGYGTKSCRGFEKQKSAEEFSQHMKALHSNNVKFTPFIHVTGKPGSTKEADWLKLSEYKKLKKEV